MSELLDSLWVEKYRPKTLESLVLPDRFRKEFEKIIQKQELPNLLFAGSAGSGKTTLARVLCSENGVLSNPVDNLLVVNGSARKTRGIAFVDDIIEPFLKHPPSIDKFKVVFIDEADKLTSDSFDSLRAIIEKYQIHYGRFIFTCNYISKIPDPIQSRFIVYTFSQIPKDFILNYCKKILDNEQVSYDEKTVQFVIDNLYPDVRKIVNTLQRNTVDNKLVVDKEQVLTTEKKVTALILQIISSFEKNQSKRINSSVTSIIDILKKQEIEYQNVYESLFFNDKVPVPAKIIVNQYSNSHQNALVPKMHFMAMVFDIIKCLKDYREMVNS